MGTNIYRINDGKVLRKRLILTLGEIFLIDKLGEILL